MLCLKVSNGQLQLPLIRQIFRQKSIKLMQLLAFLYARLVSSKDAFT